MIWNLMKWNDIVCVNVTLYQINIAATKNFISDICILRTLNVNKILIPTIILLDYVLKFYLSQKNAL